MPWNVLVAKSAQKHLANLPARDRERIAAALRAMTENPFSGDIVKLEGLLNRWRRRVGNYRIFFTVDTPSRTVAVIAILRRTSTTY